MVLVLVPRICYELYRRLLKTKSVLFRTGSDHLEPFPVSAPLNCKNFGLLDC